MAENKKKRKADEISNPSASSSRPSSLSHASPPSSSSHNWTHNVFPSFRGEDVRRDFLSHIQKEFNRKGITPFNDNGIKRGESIGPELIRAIRGSKIAMILLSRNYASSKWCLDELVEIVKCKEELGQTVMTIFYKVDPSDVKKLTGDFGNVFRKTCEGKTKEDVEKWRQALEKVATIAGYHSSNWDNEAAMIEEIVMDVSNELFNYAPSSDFNSLVGMRAHMEKMEQFLLLGCDEVRMIGIWGPSGIGKTTIARVLFGKYSSQFQLSVFMDDIKRHYPRIGSNEYSMKLKLQKDFLSQIINQEDVKIHHLGVVQDRLKDKRVLAVLDDVDHSLQLDAMAKEARWFGPGSIIIITTQDTKLLKAHGINHIYKVDFPSYYEAFQIFCTYAFGQESPYDGFEKLAWEVTELCGKLPLALKVMGSYLKRMPKQEWEEGLPRLRSRLDGETESTLKFSYDALCDEDQALFLYIACFFNGELIERVEENLADKFVGAKGGLRVLAEKSLIYVDEWRCIKMHDLLVRLGREIVRKQSIDEPGQRQFLVDAGDICQVLHNDTLGNPSVIGIDYKYTGRMELKISDRFFERMFNVQFLRLCSENVFPIPCFESLNYLPSLRFLYWEQFPMICLPSNFSPEFLVEINMCVSNSLEKLWEGNKTIRNLKWMNLAFSKNLKELPDLSTATNLRELDLGGCSSLSELPSSLANAINLRKLNLTSCFSLTELPFFIWNLVNLQELDLTRCSSLVELPSSVGNAINLEKLDLKDCSSLMELPSSIGNAINLKKLDLKNCLNLKELPSSIGNATNLGELDLGGCSSLVRIPSSIWNIVSLQRLNLSNCSSLVKLPSSFGNTMIKLEKLSLRGCTSLRELPSSMANAINLQILDLEGCLLLVKLPSSIGNLMELYIKGCSSLVELPSSLVNAINLKRVTFSGCSSLVELPFYLGNLTNLHDLDLSGCSSLRELPSSIGNMINLRILNLNGCLSLVKLPSSIGDLINLEKLDLDGCSSLMEVPSSIGNLHNLRRLCLRGCSKLKFLPININMKSLDELDLSDCSSLKSFPEISTSIRVLLLIGTAIEDIPPAIRSWSRLDTLHMSDCENLKTSQHAFDRITELHLSDTRIQEIAPWVKDMYRLQKLVIKGCTKLVSLPQLPDSLAFLDAENCESLERLDCSFYKTRFTELSFVNCFKLNQEARDLIIKTSTIGFAVFPGEEVPTCFTYRATGSSLSMKLNGFDTHVRFKACVMLVNKGDVEPGSWYTRNIYYRITDKLSGVVVSSGNSPFMPILSPASKEHLFVFEFKTTVSSAETVFEFQLLNKNFEIQECGLRPMETLDPSC